MSNTSYSKNHKHFKASWLSVIGGAFFAMGCALAFPNEKNTGVIILTMGAAMLGAFVMSQLLD